MALGKSRVSKKRAVDPEQIAEEAVKILWKAIEEAKMYIEDPMLTPEEKRRWAKTMADMIGVFNSYARNSVKPLYLDTNMFL